MRHATINLHHVWKWQCRQLGDHDWLRTFASLVWVYDRPSSLPRLHRKRLISALPPHCHGFVFAQSALRRKPRECSATKKEIQERSNRVIDKWCMFLEKERLLGGYGSREEGAWKSVDSSVRKLKQLPLAIEVKGQSSHRRFVFSSVLDNLCSKTPCRFHLSKTTRSWPNTLKKVESRL